MVSHTYLIFDDSLQSVFSLPFALGYYKLIDLDAKMIVVSIKAGNDVCLIKSLAALAN